VPKIKNLCLGISSVYRSPICTITKKSWHCFLFFLSFSIYLCRTSCNCVFMTCYISYCLFYLHMDPRNVRIYTYVKHVRTTSLTDFTLSTTHETKNFQTTFDFCIILYVPRTVTIITHAYIKNSQNLYKIKNHPYTWASCKFRGQVAILREKLVQSNIKSMHPIFIYNVKNYGNYKYQNVTLIYSWTNQYAMTVNTNTYVWVMRIKTPNIEVLVPKGISPAKRLTWN